jgi:hypothetical protein
MTHRPTTRLPVGLSSLALLLAACSQATVDTSASPSQSASPAAVSTSPSPVSITPSPTISATSSPSASITLSWSEEQFSGAVDGVVTFGDEYVAVGTIDRVPTAWTSADGESWEPHAVPYDPPDGDEPGMPGPWMGNLAEHDGWLYAIGGYQGGGDGIWPLGWRSQDGRTWEQIASQNPFYTEGYLVWGLVSGAPALLALTHGFANMSGGVWLWTPEGSWAEVTDALPATSAGAEFYDATWADGRFVVVGHGSDGGASEASAWSSTDGRTWQMNDEPYPWESNQDPLGVITAVAPTPGGGWSAFLMAPGRAVGLYSTDARSWEVSQDLMGMWSGHIWRLANVGDRLIAAGGAEGQGSWVIASSDGRTWDDSHRTDRAQAPMFHSRGGPSIASNGSSIVVFLGLLEPESSRGSVLLRASLH